MPERTAEREPSAARNIYAFGIISLLNDTATEMAYWVLPAFLATLGAGPAQLGVIEGIAESVASFSQLFSGYLADHIQRRKPVVVAGYFIANAVKPLLAIVTAWPQILLIRFCDRLSKGFRSAPRDVMVAESVPKNRLGAAYGLIQSMDSAGAIAGPLTALLMLSHFGIRSVFLAAAVPGALCVLAAWVGIRETRKARNRFGAKQRCEIRRRKKQQGYSDLVEDCRCEASSEFSFCADRRHAFFSGQFERYVSGACGRRMWGFA